jgi:hypothetical protein
VAESLSERGPYEGDRSSIAFHSTPLPRSESDLHELMQRAQAAQQAHAQKHDVQLALLSLVATPPKRDAA